MLTIDAYDANAEDPFTADRVTISPTDTILIEGVPGNGAYAHYKGGVYDVHNSFKLKPSGRRVVLYKSRTSGAWWARDVGDFLSDARVENDGDPRYVRRFIPLGRTGEE